MTQKHLTLYSVVLPWNNNDPEEGTYGNSVWAENPDEATLMVAIEMAHDGEHGTTDEEREAWAKDLIEGAGSAQTIVMRVVDTIQQDLRELLSGPDGNGADVETKLREIMDLLGEPLPEVRSPRPRG